MTGFPVKTQQTNPGPVGRQVMRERKGRGWMDGR